MTTAFVLGASGSVGAALMRELIASRAFRIVTLGRRSQPEQLRAAGDAGVELEELLLPDMTPAELEAAARAAALRRDGDIVGLSVLGIGAGTARLTIAQHRAVDVDLNAAFARGLAASAHTTHFALMSAVGADATAATGGSGAAGSSRYNRVKGEAESAVRASGIPVVSIFRPAMIIGSQHTPGWIATMLSLLTVVTPSRYRTIRAEVIARAMVATSRNRPPVSTVYHHAEMTTLTA